MTLERFVFDTDEVPPAKTAKIAKPNQAVSKISNFSNGSPQDQAVLATKLVFPGTRVLSEEEVQKMNAKGYFDPTEWAQEQLPKEGKE